MTNSSRLTDIERAFELAESGIYASVDDIKRALRAERRAATHIEASPTLAKQLRDRLTSRPKPEPKL